MADNTEDEPLENKPIAESENLSDEIISPIDTDISTPNQETENMEVHHHTHPSHGKKTWKEYFWEFLMLFLAVFCGFLAEYQLEHTIEHQRENKFAKLLLSDLCADSLYFVERNKMVETRQKKHQQFYELMTASETPTDKKILNSFLPLFYTYDLRITPATYSQMKTSGSLRYIESQKLTDILQQYYEILIPRGNQSLDISKQYYSNVLYVYFLNHFRIQDFDDEADSVKVDNPIILNRSKQTDQELLNITENYGSDQRHFQKRLMAPLIMMNNDLINLIKEEYHLK